MLGNWWQFVGGPGDWPATGPDARISLGVLAVFFP
jgi:hypothetical protein